MKTAASCPTHLENMYFFLITTKVRKSIFAGVCPAACWIRPGQGFSGQGPPAHRRSENKLFSPTNTIVISGDDTQHDIKLQLNMQTGGETRNTFLQGKPRMDARLLHTAKGKMPRCDGRDCRTPGSDSAPHALQER